MSITFLPKGGTRRTLWATRVLRCKPRQMNERSSHLLKTQTAAVSQSQRNQTPIKLTDFTFTEDQEKVVVNNMTFVSVPQPTEYAFQYSDIRTTS